MGAVWRWPVDLVHHVSGSAGGLTFVGGAGDFDGAGKIRNSGSLDLQIAGAVQNIADALQAESCRLTDVVRLKVFYSAEADDWDVIAQLAKYFPDDPMPVVSAVPEPLQPFDGQVVQIQAIACRRWRQGNDIRVAERPVPEPWRRHFAGRTVTGGLRAGEFIAVSNRTAADDGHRIAAPGDGPAQSHAIMKIHETTLAKLGASLQDSVKMEGYYFGTTREQWAPLAKARASHFAEPGPPATVVPCQRLYPEGAVTKIEVMAMRESWNGFDKYIPRGDSWPKRVWDWPIPLPYRQGIKLRDTIWLGGQVPSEPYSNTGARMLPGDLVAQTRMTMSYIEDILRGFDRSPADLKLMVCYFTCPDGEATTRLFLGTVAGCINGSLPPTTLVAKPMMHSAENTVEIWGVAQA
jgi:enamine deaminase RidA (YjgF/YER057c/UK114 family)